MTSEEAQALLAMLTAHWPKEKLSVVQAKTWLEHLERDDFELGHAACKRVIASQDWFPRIVHYRGAMSEVKAERRHAQALAAERARVKALPQRSSREAAMEGLAEARRRLRGEG